MSANRLDFALKVRAALATILILAFAPPGWAQEKDDSRDGFETKHIFGFTEGTDVGEAGDKELEFTTTGSIGKRGGGRYTAIEQEAVYEAAPSERFGYEIGPLGISQQIANVAGLSNLSQTTFSGFTVEPKYIFVKRGIDAPFGFAVSVAPEWSRIETVTGDHVSNFELGDKSLFRLGTDREEALCRHQSCLCAGNRPRDRHRIQPIRPDRGDGRADVAHHAVTRDRRRDRILPGL